MHIESRDSSSVKPAELDEFGQLLESVGLPLDSQLEAQLDKYPLLVVANTDGLIEGFLFGSLERLGGTPCILWGLGAIRKSKASPDVLKSMTGELFRRAAISFPDEDVLVGVRLSHPSVYSTLSKLKDIVPRKNYEPTGEEKQWGKRLAKRFDCGERYDSSTFKVKAGKRPEPIFDASTVKSGGKAATDMVGTRNPVKGEAMISFGWAMAEQLANGKLH